MSIAMDLRVVELLASRICHDLIGPVAAVNNGAELLTDEDPEFIADAVTLVGDSARKAIRRLQFFRFAYGFGGGASSAAPHALVAELFEDTSIDCDYSGAVRELPLEWQKLACNMAAVAAEALARGGRVVLNASEGVLTVEANGEGAAAAPELAAALTLTLPISELSSRNIGAHFAGLLAQSLGCRLTAMAEAGRFCASAPLAGVL